MGLGNVSLNLLESVDDAVRFKVWLGQRRDVLAIDTETGGLEWWLEPLRLVQFGDLETGWAIPWDRWGGVVLEALREYDGDVVMHNAKFDTHFLEHHSGTTLKRSNIHDTRVMAHLLWPDMPTGLKPLAERLVDRKAANASRILDEAMQTQKWTWRTVPVDFEPYWMYGALDCVLTAHLHEQLYPQVRAASNNVYETEMGVTWVLLNMERRGPMIDLPYTEEKLGEFLAYVESVREWCHTTYGVNPGSTKQVTSVMKADGVDLTKTTPTGAYALDEEVLLQLADAHPLARPVLSMRKLDKLAKTYLQNFLEMNVDGFLHPNINSLGARTGRMSMDKPALQTLPRPDVSNPAAITVRNCFVARPGNTLVLCDFQQIEQRLMAHFSQDPGMIEAFSSGDDVFTAMARQIFSDPSIQKSDERRQHTKNAAYAKAYGAGAAKFAMTAGVDFESGKQFLDIYDARFPGVRAFQRRVEQVAMERIAQEGQAYVSTPLGRRQPSEQDGLYKLVNYLIQGTAADVLKRKLVELDMVGLGDYLILPVHDEVIMDVPKEDAEEAAQLMRTTMEDRDSFVVPLTVDLDITDRWGLKYS